MSSTPRQNKSGTFSIKKPIIGVSEVNAKGRFVCLPEGSQNYSSKRCANDNDGRHIQKYNRKVCFDGLVSTLALTSNRTLCASGSAFVAEGVSAVERSVHVALVANAF